MPSDGMTSVIGAPRDFQKQVPGHDDFDQLERDIPAMAHDRGPDLDHPVASQGWLMKLDPADGTVLGLIAVPETHSVSVTKQGEPLIGVRPNRVFRYQEQPNL